jgi:hypothetical protein
MIAFDNFEKTTNDAGHINKIEEVREPIAPYTLDKRYLESVPEEYIESEEDTPLEFPNVVNR